MEAKTISIQKLNGKNFYMWKFKIELLLLRDKLWGTISQDPPATSPDEWITRDQAAKATICLAIEDNLLVNIRHCTTAKDTWKTLLKLYEHPSLSTVLHLMRKLYSTRYSDYLDMREYVNAILELVGQLTSMGESVNDKSIITIMLCGLPPDYNNLITAIERKEEEKLTLEFVKMKLFEESSRREKEYTPTQHESLAMPTMRNNYRTNNQIICYGCGKQGHTKRECNRDVSKMGGNRWTYHNSSQPNEQTMRNKYLPSNTGDIVMSSTEDMDPYKSWQQEERKNQSDEEEHQACCKCAPKKNEEYTALSGTLGEISQNWIIDSGASAHMTPFKDFFQDIVYLKTKIPITLANGTTVYAEGKGSGLVNLNNDFSRNDIVRICDVLYVPTLQFQLLSIKQLCKRGHNVSFGVEGCIIVNNNSTIATARLQGGTFVLNENIKPEPIILNSCIHRWHTRMGHRSNDTLLKMSRNELVDNMKIDQCQHPDFCKTCQIGKMRQKSFTPNQQSTNKPFQTLVTDVCGPMQEPSLGGNCYILTIADRYSKFLHTELIKLKSQVPEKIMNYLEKGHNMFGYYPLVIRSDGGGEYRSNTLEEYLSKHGIAHQTIVPYAPQQNGQAERVNYTIMNTTRCLLKQSGLPLRLWGEATSTATYLINRTCHSSTGKTPFELWNKTKPNLDNLKTFGCQAFAFTPKNLRRKLDDTSTEGYFVGYGINTKGYRMWIPETNKVITSAKMTFNEDVYYKPKPTTPHSHTQLTDGLIMEFTPMPQEIPICEVKECLRRSSRENKGIPAEKLTY